MVWSRAASSMPNKTAVKIRLRRRRPISAPPRPGSAARRACSVTGPAIRKAYGPLLSWQVSVSGGAAPPRHANRDHPQLLDRNAFDLLLRCGVLRVLDGFGGHDHRVHKQACEHV